MITISDFGSSVEERQSPLKNVHFSVQQYVRQKEVHDDEGIGTLVISG
jgi:hypothetical protein